MGRDKAMLGVDGVPMAERVAGALASAGCDPVVFVGGTNALADLGRAHVADRWPGEGPLGGVITALAHHGDDVVVAACDLPFLAAPTVQRLTAVDLATVDVVVACTDRLEPALARWSSTVLPELERLHADGVRALRDAVAQLRSHAVDVDPSALRNVNSPNDLPTAG